MRSRIESMIVITQCVVRAFLKFSLNVVDQGSGACHTPIPSEFATFAVAT